MSAKLATVDLLKIKVLYNKGYDVIISVQDDTSKILTCDPKFYCRCDHDQSLITLAFL